LIRQPKKSEIYRHVRCDAAGLNISRIAWAGDVIKEVGPN